MAEIKKKKSFLKKTRRRGNSISTSQSQEMADASLATSEEIKTRVAQLLAPLTHEFERLYTENISLRDKVNELSEKIRTGSGEAVEPLDSGDYTSQLPKQKTMTNKAGRQLSQKIRTTYKAGTSKIVSSFKNSSNLDSRVVREYAGHVDGVWDVACFGLEPIVGTASADRKARIWCAETGTCLLEYSEHTGSVNSIRFHPKNLLVCTASGDTSVHVWESPSLDQLAKVTSSGDEAQDCGAMESSVSFSSVEPKLKLSEHNSVVIAADWFCDGDQLVSASWDHTAKLWDIHTGQSIYTLTGHDLELTNCCTHPSQRLLLTSSTDGTFRLCDFRAPTIHSVNVFQGHSECVTTATFTPKDNIVSASDDRSIKVWDLKNMRAPVSTIRVDAGCNRLGVSSHGGGVIAAPLDNRAIRFYHVNGTRYIPSRRARRQGHGRMVCAAAWNEDASWSCNLFSCGFDGRVIGWKVGL